MTTISHEPSSLAKRSVWFEARDLWASLAIVAIWLAVLFASVFGGNIVAQSSSGDGSTIPMGLGVAFFALFATMAVAKWGFGKRKPDDVS